MKEKKEFDILARPVSECAGSITVPGDKSISHRSIILGSLAEGTTTVGNVLRGEDSLATMQAFRDMGITIHDDDEDIITIEGNGMHGLRKANKELWLGNSGTAMRLMTGLLSAQQFATTLQGDESLSARPMGRVIDPLVQMGASIQAREKQYAPIHIEPVPQLSAIDYTLPVASAQVKSALLLAALYADGPTTIVQLTTTRNHSELMLRQFAVQIHREQNSMTVQPTKRLQACQLHVPSDISSAAFFLVGGCIASQGEICLREVGVNPTRTGVIRILQAMGADIVVEGQTLRGMEAVADIRVRPSQLNGIEIPQELVPLAIDEFPAIFVAAACAQGTTTLRGAQELKVKESDRIDAMVDGLTALGIHASALADGVIIQGGRITGGEVDSCKDHRIAMAFAMASLAAREQIRIRNCRNIETSFPGFIPLANSVGLNMHRL